MQTDVLIQTLFKSLSTIRWKDYDSNPRFRWYYAENNCYFVNDKVTNGMWFVQAKSPVKACDYVIAKFENGKEGN